MTEAFDDKPAVRRALPLMVGLISPSGGGKTLSALRLATGMQRVTGGEIFFVDTEADRALYYADDFKFRHVSFGAPFNPGRYLEAAKYCVGRGAKIVIFDSMSFEHEGTGGVLEMFEEEFKRTGRKESMRMLSWGPPKSERRSMIQGMLALKAHFLFCFRAKNKIKLKKRGEEGEAVRELGYVAITDDDLLYELPTRFLLMPGACGYPTWNPSMMGERLMPRLPRQFVPLFQDAVQLGEDIGESMARWASGDAAPTGNTDGKIVNPTDPVFHWKTNTGWNEKPLRSAPIDVLRAYQSSIANALKDPKNERQKARITKWHEEVCQEIEAFEAEDAIGDIADDGDNDSEAAQ